MTEPATTRRGAGRPTKLTPKVTAAVVKALEAGAYLDDAAAFAGIHYATLADWMQKAREGKGQRFSDFAEAVQRAQSKAVVADLQIIKKAAKRGDWRAAAWVLEHRNPAKFGPNVKLQVQSEHQQLLKLAKEALSPEDYERLLTAYASRAS